MTQKTPFLQFGEALNLLRELAHCTLPTEQVDLTDAYGRVLAEDIIALRDLPPCDNSAMDGYAIHPAGMAAAAGPYPVVMEVFAGSTPPAALEAGQAARIFTGATVPEGAVFVAPQEDCTEEQTGNTRRVTLSRAYPTGCNIRRKGEDRQQGAAILASGQVLRPQDVATMAAEGKAKALVYRALKVGIFSTGDELVRPGDELGPDKIVDTNHFLLRGMLSNLPVELVDLGILKDDRAFVERALVQAANTCDVIITSGGAGGGDADFVGQTLKNLGQLTFWHLAVKPGRPFLVGRLPSCIFIGLPGNPVAATVAFSFLARPLLLALAGRGFEEPVRQQIPADFSLFNRKTGRRDFLRGKRVVKDDELRVVKYHSDGSALLSSLTFADGFIELPEDLEQIAEGDLVSFVSFDEIGLR